MIQAIVEIINQFPPPLATILLATLPVGELRLAIPTAIHLLQILPVNAFGLAVLGNLLPLVPLYFGLDKIKGLFEKNVPPVKRIIDWAMSRAEKRVEKKYAQYGAFALFLFTAIPLPFTGLWTATLAAVALKIPFKHAIVGIIPGVFVAGIIVTVASVTVDVAF